MNSRLSFWLLVFATVCFCQQVVWCRPADEDDSYQDDTMDNTDTEDYNQDESDSGDEEVKGPPPKFLNDPQKERKKQGDSVEFSCNVSNVNDLVVMWLNGSSMLFLDGDAQTQDKRVRLNKNTNTLHIDRVQWYDSGKYTCEVSAYPTAITIVHVLEVLKPAEITRLVPNRNYFILENETLGLVCSVSGYPIPEVIWHRKGDLMPSGVKEEKTDRVTYKSVSRSDSGVYECVAKNDQGEDRAHVNVTVRFPPIIHIERELVPAGLNYETVLKCEAQSEPRPSLKWLHKNDIVNPDQNIFIRNEGNMIELKITKTDESHFGDYECEAKNAVGTQRRKITVSGIPGAAVWKGSQTIKDDDMWAELNWTVESYSPIQEYILKFRHVGEKGWQEVKPEVKSPEGNIYSVTQRVKLPAPGEYEAILLSNNKYGWSPEPRPAHRFTTDFLAAEAAANELSSGPDPENSGASDTRPTFFFLHYFLLILTTLLTLY